MIAILSVGALGPTWHVDDATCPASGSGTPASPFCKIQDAICVAASGDTISVQPGTYLEAIRVRPGVRLESTGGPAGTTINAAGRACPATTYCSTPAGTQCSAVTFGPGHTASTVLTGFTIRGGAGLVESGTGFDLVAGGGIYIESSPTITNNVITNNIISGPSLNGKDLRGAGVYVLSGQPVISNNTIAGNRAIPTAGSSSNPSSGYGGGIYVGFYSAPVIRGNIIQNNVAGDPNVADSTGAGGGIVANPGQFAAGPVIDRNLIADNTAFTSGGGVSLLSITNTMAIAQVTNNVIVGNSAQMGGGVYTYFNKSHTINNTITGNTAFQGGGVFASLTDAAHPAFVSNNIISGNNVTMFGVGGGVFYIDLEPGFDPTTISFNDLWGNSPTQCGGEISEPNCLTMNDNFSSDPLFVNPAARDYHLGVGSPAIDRAQESLAPPVDKDNVARGLDGDGLPDSPELGDVDVGAYESLGGCLAQPEVCDGADNNCDTVIDEGFPNTDGDSQADCLDTDDDNDGALDAGDCAPLDGTAFGSPVEIANVTASGTSPTQIGFDTQAIGSGTRYQTMSGLLLRLAATGAFQESFCAVTSLTAAPWPDSRPAPPLGDGWFYLVRAYNACGLGTYGSALRDAPGAGDVCQAGVVDQDGDGSPSDLDCNDNNINLSPVNPEICDGVDNDCDMVADENNPQGGQSCGVTNVGECQLGTTLCASGSLVCDGAILPGPELCDGKDNDCDGAIDNNVVDSDSDGQNDCVDVDDDNDTVLDGSDCAPRDATAFGVPTEVVGLDAQAGIPTPLTWTAQSIGSGTVYRVAAGLLVTPGSINFPAASCMTTVSSPPTLDSLPAPPAGQARYYLVKSTNACGAGTYGSPAKDTIPPCP